MVYVTPGITWPSRHDPPSYCLRRLIPSRAAHSSTNGWHWWWRSEEDALTRFSQARTPASDLSPSVQLHPPQHLQCCDPDPDPDPLCKLNTKRQEVQGGGESVTGTKPPPRKQRSSGTYCSVTLDCLWSRWQAARWGRGEYACKAMTRWLWSFCSGSWSSISKGKRKKYCEIKTENPWGVSSSAALLRPNHYSSFAQRAVGATLSFLFSQWWWWWGVRGVEGQR